MFIVNVESWRDSDDYSNIAFIVGGVFSTLIKAEEYIENNVYGEYYIEEFIVDSDKGGIEIKK